MEENLLLIVSVRFGADVSIADEICESNGQSKLQYQLLFLQYDTTHLDMCTSDAAR